MSKLPESYREQEFRHCFNCDHLTYNPWTQEKPREQGWHCGITGGWPNYQKGVCDDWKPKEPKGG